MEREPISLPERPAVPGAAGPTSGSPVLKYVVIGFAVAAAVAVIVAAIS